MNQSVYRIQVIVLGNENTKFKERYIRFPERDSFLVKQSIRFSYKVKLIQDVREKAESEMTPKTSSTATVI